MASFRTIDHKVPTQHIREYRQATTQSQEDVLHLCVRQYIPLDISDPKPGDITIIGAHGNGFPKEVYEPLWDDLLEQSRLQGWRIRSIWMADAANQGQSGIANERLMGNEPSWNDHARDLMLLINLKRDEMPRPIVGIGHSMGGTQLGVHRHKILLSLMHPRLLTSLVLLDSIILPLAAVAGPVKSLLQMSTCRRDLWPSREAAVASFNKAAVYRAWDPRVLQKWIESGLRNTPTIIHPNEPATSVTLATSPAQEGFTTDRPNFERYGIAGTPINRVTHADVTPRSDLLEHKFYRPEIYLALNRLPELRPSVLFVRGGSSLLGTTESHEDIVSKTGTGIGGSGGKEEGRVDGTVLDKVGHLIPMEAPGRSAQVAAAWIGTQVMQVMQEESNWKRDWDLRTLKQKQEIDDVWRQIVGGPLKRSKM